METPTLLLGAGPGGLAAAACLRARSLPFVQLERATAIGPTWRNHYERLHLHTVRRHSALPMFPMPSEWPRYPSRAQVVSYLESYAAHFKLAPRLGVDVRKIAPQQDRWAVETSEGTWSARNVIVATGYNRVPNLPSFPGIGRFEGSVVHSADYRHGRDLAGRRVLVVGCGNSGAEIALDLCEQGAEASMVVRGPVHVLPRDLFGRPAQATSILLSRLPLRIADALGGLILRLVVGDLSRWGIRRPAKGPLRMVVEEGRVSLLDVGTIARVKAGEITVTPGVAAFHPREVEFADGSRRPFDAVILATGYRSGLRSLLPSVEGVLSRRELPVVHGEQAASGLWFTGFRNPPTGALREIGLEAPRIAAGIAARA
jgi:hypothetical protein